MVAGLGWGFCSRIGRERLKVGIFRAAAPGYPQGLKASRLSLPLWLIRCPVKCEGCLTFDKIIYEGSVVAEMKQTEVPNCEA